ncbi:MAG: Mrp/NBP35 family ATP-binding protein [Desulfobacter sp.]|nr:MAG: Mrp/NBP35 family ATP-binding protein [Desulfobacter sp.]
MKQKQKAKGIMDSMPAEDPNAEVKETLRHITHKFMIMSGKGGVGKSSVSVNLATALATMGHRVGLMDVDIHGPDIPRMLGIKGDLHVNDAKKIIPAKYSPILSVVSIESLMPDKDAAIIWRGPAKHSAIRQFVGDVEWGALDYLIIDAPPGTGDEPLTVAQLIKDAKALIVTTPQEVALADVRKSIRFCRQVNMEIFGLVENMSGYTCPKCGEVLDIFGTGGGERTAGEQGIPFLGKIPLDPSLVAFGDAGRSIQVENPSSPVTKAFRTLAEEVARRS